MPLEDALCNKNHIFANCGCTARAKRSLAIILAYGGQNNSNEVSHTRIHPHTAQRLLTKWFFIYSMIGLILTILLWFLLKNATFLVSKICWMWCIKNDSNAKNSLSMNNPQFWLNSFWKWPTQSTCVGKIDWISASWCKNGEFFITGQFQALLSFFTHHTLYWYSYIIAAKLQLFAIFKTPHFLKIQMNPSSLWEQFGPWNPTSKL